MGVQLILFFVYVGGYTRSDADFSRVVSESNKLTVVNGCSDIYTVLDPAQVFSRINTAAGTVKSTMVFFILFLLGMMF